MEINFIDESKKQTWNEFLIANNGNFLQSFEWGNFQEQSSLKVWRVEVREDNKKILVAQIIKERISRLSNFYIPYGPVFNQNATSKEKQEAFNLFLKNIRQLAQKENTWFLRIEPIVVLPKLDNLQFKNPFKRNQPQRTLVLDLDKSEKELFDALKTKTGYNIKLAQRKGVTIKILDDYSPVFYDLVKGTGQRQQFSSFTKEHYMKFFQVKSQDFQVKMFLAEYQGKVIVASVVVFFGNKAISLHTGSDYQYRTVKGADLLRWKVILYAKERGLKQYDFWGIDDKKFPGVSSFKRGFHGREVEYPLGVDVIFNNTGYQFYRIIRAIKQLF